MYPNMLSFGIFPLTFKSESDYEEIDAADEIEIPNVRPLISKNEPLVVKNLTKETEFEANYDLSERQRSILLAGGMLPHSKMNKTKVIKKR